MRFREVRAEGKKITKYFEIINPARQNQVQVEGLRVLHFVLELSRSNDITTVDLKKVRCTHTVTAITFALKKCYQLNSLHR